MSMDFNNAGGPRGDQVRDLFDSEADFDDLLSEAETCAETDWEIDFITDIRDRFDKYGERTIVTPAQLSKLREIAGHA